MMRSTTAIWMTQDDGLTEQLSLGCKTFAAREPSMSPDRAA